MRTLSQLPPTQRVYRITFRADYDRPEAAPREILVAAPTRYEARRGFDRRYGHVHSIQIEIVR
jgi:hypothetical protein